MEVILLEKIAQLGDPGDLVNVKAGKVIVGLIAKAKAKKDKGNFVVDTDLIAVG